MEIQEHEISRRTKPVLVRLTAETHDWLEKLATEAGGGIATVIRAILETAQTEGVEVVKRKN